MGAAPVADRPHATSASPAGCPHAWTVISALLSLLPVTDKIDEAPQPLRIPYEIPPDGSLGLLAAGYRGLLAWRAVRGTDWLDERRIERETWLDGLSEEKRAELKKASAEPLRASPEALAQSDLVVVSGLPRSGTSMLMQMLTAGGLTAFTDKERGADVSNPKGYFEHALVRALPTNRAWVPDASGHAVKVVAPLLPYLPGGPTYQTILIERDLDEVLRSQSSMLDALGRAPGHSDKLRDVYVKQLASARKWIASFAERGGLILLHREVITEPAQAALRIRDYLNADLDVVSMASVVDSTLYRQREA